MAQNLTNRDLQRIVEIKRLVLTDSVYDLAKDETGVERLTAAIVWLKSKSASQAGLDGFICMAQERLSEIERIQSQGLTRPDPRQRFAPLARRGRAQRWAVWARLQPTTAYNQKLMAVVEVAGDAARLSDGPVLLAHVCNDKGYFGAGFSGSVGRAFPVVEAEYRRWARDEGGQLPLGSTQFVKVGADQWVANMIGQHGVRSRSNPTPIDYQALERCLHTIMAFAGEHQARVQMPRIGAGLAGGDWAKIAAMIDRIAESRQVAVAVITPGFQQVL
jgi:O-acetyl-ADP-ribose deacetylase (regulator of RNase III)